MELGEQLNNLSLKQLSKIHEILGLDEEYRCWDCECKGDYIMHIFEKDEKEIIKALKKISQK